MQSQRTTSFQNWLAENFSRMTTEPPADQNRAGRQHAADAVIHRQAVVHPVCRLRVHHAGEPVAPLHDPGMADVGGLGQPGCAGGVDVERPIFDGHWPPLGLRSAVRPMCRSISRSMRRNELSFAAVNPDRGAAESSGSAAVN